MEAQLHGGGFTIEHLEQPIGVFRQILAGEFRAGDSGSIQEGNLCHAVYTVGSNAVTLGPGQQIAVFVVLAKAIGAGFVILIAIVPLAIDAPIEVPELNLLIPSDGFLDGVYIIINGFIHALDPAGNHHVPAHQPGIVDAALYENKTNVLFKNNKSKY